MKKRIKPQIKIIKTPIKIMIWMYQEDPSLKSRREWYQENCRYYETKEPTNDLEIIS